MADFGDDIWASSREEVAAAAPPSALIQLPDFSSIQRSLAEIDTLPTAQETLAQVISVLRASSSPSAAPADAVNAIRDLHGRWMQESIVVNDVLWFQVAELSGWLAADGDVSSLGAFTTTALKPATLPNKAAFCDKSRQISFALQLVDALSGYVTNANASAVFEAIVSWLLRAMAEYEFIFIHHVSQPLVDHIQKEHSMLSESLAQAADRFADQAAENWHQHAPQIAVAAVLLSASSHTTALRTLHAIATSSLQKEEVFPHIHQPLAVVAIALQTSPLAVSPSSLLHQFVVFRVSSLGFVSPQLLTTADDIKRLSERYQESLYRSQLSDMNVETGLRMMDAFVAEIKSAIETNPSVLNSILRAMRSRSETEVFSPSLIALQEQLEAKLTKSEAAFPVDQVLAGVYDSIATGIQALHQSPSSLHVLHCFSVLSELEFARECCATPERNDLMVRLTQRIEDMVETAPDATLSTLANSLLANHEARENNVVFGWACLAVGLIVQRKLRVVVFQAGENARRDAFAAVFAGLYHGLVPLSSFAHRFLGFSLASLGQFVSVYEIFPFYLQETLRRFPSDVSKEQAASVLGTVFGSLYYTNTAPALTEEEKKIEASAAETRNAMILWALRQSSQRCKELLPLEGGENLADGLYLAELFLEVAKMAPVELLPTVAREMEALVYHSSQVSDKALDEVKVRVFNAVSVNCEAEKRAWLAAWFLELSSHYPSAKDALVDAALAKTETSSTVQPPSRL